MHTPFIPPSLLSLHVYNYFTPAIRRFFFFSHPPSGIRNPLKYILSILARVTTCAKAPRTQAGCCRHERRGQLQADGLSGGGGLMQPRCPADPPERCQRRN